MSEEILKALMQLFAIIAKQDEGVETTQLEYVRNFLQQQLNDEKVKEYYGLFRQYSGLHQMIFGGILIATVIFLPRGIMGLFQDIGLQIRRRMKRVVPHEPA